MSRGIVLLGTEGSGKSYLLSKLRDIYHFTLLSTGKLCRDAATVNPLGEIATCLSRGDRAPDEHLMPVVQAWLRQQTLWGMDGFPRGEGQAKYLDNVLEIESAHAIFVELQLSPDKDKALRIATGRLAPRLICTECNASYGGPVRPRQAGYCDSCNTALTTRADDLDASRLLKRFEHSWRELEGMRAHYGFRLHTVCLVDDPQRNLEMVRKIADSLFL